MASSTANNSEKQPKSNGFKPGHSGNPNGRPKGSQNKVTKAAKDFITELADDPAVQRAVRRKILKGDIQGYLGALKYVLRQQPTEIEAKLSVDRLIVFEGTGPLTANPGEPESKE